MQNNNFPSVKDADILRVPDMPHSKLHLSHTHDASFRSVTKQCSRRSRSQSPGTSSIALHSDVIRQPLKRDSHNPKYMPSVQETPRITLTPTPPRNPMFNSTELLRSHEQTNSTTSLLQLRVRPHSLASSCSKRALKASSSSEDVDAGRIRDTSLENACRNVSNSSRSLLENFRKERVGNAGDGFTNTKKLTASKSQLRSATRREGDRCAGSHLDHEVTIQKVTKLPGSEESAPVYVFGDSPPDHPPSLLQRSKTFFLQRTNSVRQSFKSRTNSASTKTSKSAKNVQQTVQPSQRISLVFAQTHDENNDIARLPIAHNSKKTQQKSSFVALRKRLFSKNETSSS